MQKNLTPRWTDLRVPLEQTRINPATSKPDYGTFLGNTKIYLFDPTTPEGVTFTIQMPHEYKLYSDIVPHVHFVPTTTNTGTVRFGLEFTYACVNETFPVTTTIYTNAVACSGIANKQQIASFGKINPQFSDLSCILSCYLFRDAANDTYTGDCGVLEFDIHYQQDGFGSKTEFLKD